jgi:hypothetical protein
MNCSDFRELADSYLSDELAVETNHQVFKHLENCADCRTELSIRREVREKLRFSMRNEPEFQISPTFSVGLRDVLHQNAAKKNAWTNWKTFVPVFASVLIVAVFGFFLLYQKSSEIDLTTSVIDDTLQSYIVEMSHNAIGDHKFCALEKLKIWEENAGKGTVEQAAFVKILRDDETKVLAVHNCEYAGKTFHHYILQRGGKIISVAKFESEYSNPTNKKFDNLIISEHENGLQVASFQDGGNLVFVVSDMSESENLGMARILSDSLKSKV